MPYAIAIEIEQQQTKNDTTQYTNELIQGTVDCRRTINHANQVTTPNARQRWSLQSTKS